MRWLPTLPLLLSACSQAPAPAPEWEQGPLPFDQTGAGVVLQLDRLPADCGEQVATPDQRTHEMETVNGLSIPAGATCRWTVELVAGSSLQSRVMGGSLEVSIGGWSNHRTARVGPRDFSSTLGGVSGQVEVIAHNPGERPVLWGSPDLVAPPTRPPRRVVVIGIDTLRPDHLSLNGYPRETTPNLDRWAADGAVVFDRAWTPAPRTRPSFRTATTGRQPLAAVGAPTIGEVFDENGFATAGFVANVHLDPRFDFPDGFGRWHLDNGAKAPDQVQRALDWLEDNRHRDTYLFLHIMDPHIFYVAPEPFGSRWIEERDPTLPEKFNRWAVYEWDKTGVLDDRRKQQIEAGYDGEIAYTDSELLRLLGGIDALPGDALVVMHSDHGEEFWEHGGFEHNHTLYDELVRAVLMVRPPASAPRSAARSAVSATLADIAPTLYDYVGFTQTPETDGVSLRPAVEGATTPGPDRLLPIAFLMYGMERWGVVSGDRKYILELATGHQELYDLANDPGEQHDLAAEADLTPWHQRLSEAHGMPVGPGLRLAVQLRGQALKLTLPVPALQAGVLDPEDARERRTNQAWGKRAPVSPEDVAEVTLSEDGLTVDIAPGRKGNGTLLLRFASPFEGALQLEAGDERITVSPGEQTAAGRAKVAVSAGVVAFPQLGEAARMEALARGGTAEEAQLSLLEALGYVGDDEEEED